jgi:hypothetical protein
MMGDDPRDVFRDSGVHYQTTAHVDRIPPYDKRSGDHYWIVPLVFRVDPSTWEPGEAINLDRENLVYAAGAGCYFCEARWEPRLMTRRCPGEPPAHTTRVYGIDINEILYQAMVRDANKRKGS